MISRIKIKMNLWIKCSMLRINKMNWRERERERERDTKVVGSMTVEALGYQAENSKGMEKIQVHIGKGS